MERGQPVRAMVWQGKGMQNKRNIRELIRDKAQWAEPLSSADTQLGFRGWHSRGYLPHYDIPGKVQMITYRLADAMPADKRHEWSQFLEIEDEREQRIKIEEYLDAGRGECLLRRPEIAALVEENFLHFDGVRYHLLAWIVMPNHVHVLAEITDMPMSVVVKNWKSYTAKAANRLLERNGTLWQEDYFDRYMRDEEHLRKAVRYIENNPVKAGLVKFPAEWMFSSARFRGESGLLGGLTR
jgi:REP element-mobilizing transposase RayT